MRQPDNFVSFHRETQQNWKELLSEIYPQALFQSGFQAVRGGVDFLCCQSPLGGPECQGNCERFPVGRKIFSGRVGEQIEERNRFEERLILREDSGADIAVGKRQRSDHGNVAGG